VVAPLACFPSDEEDIVGQLPGDSAACAMIPLRSRQPRWDAPTRPTGSSDMLHPLRHKKQQPLVNGCALSR